MGCFVGQLLACGSSELLLEAVDFVRFYDTLGSRFHLSAAVVEQVPASPNLPSKGVPAANGCRASFGM